MPKSQHESVYTANAVELGDESKRLREFDMPTKISIDAIGPLRPESVLLDIGAGENPGLREYALDSDAHYVPLDIREEPLKEHQQFDTAPLLADARDLSFIESGIVDVVHSRFVLGHLPQEGRTSMVSGSLKTLKPGGKAVFIDYDWTSMHGSDAVNKLRDFTLSEITIFDAGFGAKSAEELSAIAGDTVSLESKRTSPPLQKDYRPMLGLRQVTLKGLEVQGASEDKIKTAEEIFDAIAKEAESEQAPGFYMPDIVSVTINA